MTSVLKAAHIGFLYHILQIIIRFLVLHSYGISLSGMLDNDERIDKPIHRKMTLLPRACNIRTWWQLCEHLKIYYYTKLTPDPNFVSTLWKRHNDLYLMWFSCRLPLFCRSSHLPPSPPSLLVSPISLFFTLLLPIFSLSSSVVCYTVQISFSQPICNSHIILHGHIWCRLLLLCKWITRYTCSSRIRAMCLCVYLVLTFWICIICQPFI